MNHPLSSPAEFFRLLRTHPRRWLWPAAVVAALTTLYALTKSDTWEASQAVIVRNQAAGNSEGPGKFNRPEDLKLTQETILEIGKSPGVLSAALSQVGPPESYRHPEAWPTPRDVADLAEAVRFTPPKGAELGATEVFYVKVKNRDRLRAANLAMAICDQLQARFQKLRDQRAQSMVDELTKSVALAQSDLEASTSRLTQVERAVGPDLAELRSLQERGSGDSDLRRRSVEIENELRQAQTAERNNRALLALLTAARDNPGSLLATPNRLLESQPALKRLKEGLVDSQLRTAQLLGTMTVEHPLVQAARANEQAVEHDLHAELQSAVAGLDVDLRLSGSQVESLRSQLADIKARMEKLAGVRAEYANLAAEAQHKSTLLESAQRDLAAARSSQASAQAASQITRIDAPDTGTRPIGPSRAMIVLAGVAGGLLSGLGLVFLGLPLPPTSPAKQPLPSFDEETTEPFEPEPLVGAAAGASVAANGLSFTHALQKAHTRARNGNGAHH